MKARILMPFLLIVSVMFILGYNEDGTISVSPNGGNPDNVTLLNLEAGVSYDYEASSTSHVFVIGKDRYEELNEQNQFVIEKQITKSTFGPAFIDIKTNLPQPIPVMEGSVVGFYFGIINNYFSDGNITVTSIDIDIPAHFKPIDGRKCDLCKVRGEDVDDVWQYSLKELYGEDYELSDCGSNIEAPDGKKNPLNISENVKIFKCYMEYQANGNMLYFKKPLGIHANFVYTFTPTKNVTISTRTKTSEVF